MHTYYTISLKLQRQITILVEVDKVEKEESATGIASYRVKITERGLRFLKNIDRIG